MKDLYSLLDWAPNFPIRATAPSSKAWVKGKALGSQTAPDDEKEGVTGSLALGLFRVEDKAACPDFLATSWKGKVRFDACSAQAARGDREEGRFSRRGRRVILECPRGLQDPPQRFGGL